MKNTKGKFTLKGFAPRVDEISYDANGNINGLAISNKGECIYRKGLK